MPAWLTLTMHVPVDTMIAPDPDTVQIHGVSEVNVTGRPELAPADNGTGLAAKVCGLGGDTAFKIWLRFSTVKVKDWLALGNVPLTALKVSG